MEEEKIVMLQSNLKGFYASSISIEELKSICTLDNKSVEFLKLVDSDFEDVTNKLSMNLSNLKFKELITALEKHLAPKTLMEFALKLDNTFELNFQTGELSICAKSPNEIESTAAEILKNAGYKGFETFEKLKSYKQAYIAIDEEEAFEFLYLHPYNEEDENE